MLAFEDVWVEYRRERLGRTESTFAAQGVNLRIEPGEALGLAGESGSGKSTLAGAALGLIRPQRGRVLFDGVDLLRAPRAERRRLLSRIGVVWQDPYDSLDPKWTVGAAIAEPMMLAGWDAERRRERVMRRLADVELAAADAEKYPHELSGGQRQRAALARALALDPDLLILDEPLSALDVSIAAQILALLRHIRESRRASGNPVSVLLISHDLELIGRLCVRAAVLYAGHLCEVLPAVDLSTRAAHPYTRALLASRPVLGRSGRLRAIPGEPARTHRAHAGCPFAPRCEFRRAECDGAVPPLRAPSPGHAVSCVLHTASEQQSAVSIQP